MSDERDEMLIQVFSKEATEDTDAHFVERISKSLPREIRRRTIVRTTLAIIATMTTCVIALLNLDVVSSLGNTILIFATDLSHYPLVAALLLIVVLPIMGIVRR